MVQDKRGQGNTFFIIVAAALALVLLVVLIIITSKGVGGPFSRIFDIGAESGNRGEFCADVNDQNLCENFAKVKCEGAEQGFDAPDYSCETDAIVDGWEKSDTEYICIGRKGCDSGKSCCHTK